jgi:hypothetical protein
MTTPTSTERIQHLAEFLRQVVPDEVSSSENAVETAIRIIETQHRAIAALVESRRHPQPIIIETQQSAIVELIEAIRLSVEYVGMDVLQPHPGWSWYDALAKYDPKLLDAMLHPPQVVIDPADQAPIGESR